MGRPPKYKNDDERRVAKAQMQRAYRERQSRSFRNAEALTKSHELIKIDRPPVRYYGGKWRIASWIIDQFPPHTCYCEPFAGGASVLLQKIPSRIEVLNDLNHDVITFFDVLRSRTSELIRAILLTPYSREELARARENHQVHDPLEQARRFYVRCWQSFGSGVGKSSTGWRYQIGTGNNSRASVVGSWNDVEHLWSAAERLKMVFIEHDNAFKVITRFDSSETLFYVDPPYVHSTRNHDSIDKGYSHELTDQDHERLATVLKALKGYVIVSGYPSGLYDELFGEWQCIRRQSLDVNGVAQTECLWLSPRTVSINHLPLFASAGDR